MCNPALAFQQGTSATREAMTSISAAGFSQAKASLAMPCPALIHFDSLRSHPTTKICANVIRYVVNLHSSLICSCKVLAIQAHVAVIQICESCI